MAPSDPPNPAIAELAAVLGRDDVRTLVRTFLRDFPVSRRGLDVAGSPDRHRLAHSMKSSSRLMGAPELSQLMAGLEHRLAEDPAAAITADELAEIDRRFATVAASLERFVAD